MNTVILNHSKIGLNDTITSKSSKSVHKYCFKFHATNLKSLTKKSASVGLCLQIDNPKQGKNKSKSLFKKDKLEIDIPLIRDSKKAFLRKNALFKVLLKSGKNNAKVIAQAICNVADLTYPPEKANMVFEQKLNLKFHKAMGPANVLKQYASLNLSVKSMLKTNLGNGSPSKNILKSLDKTANRKLDNTSYLQDDISNITESFPFDFEESMQLDNNFDSILFEESPIRNSINKKKEMCPGVSIYNDEPVKVNTYTIDLNAGSKTSRNQDKSKKYKKIDIGDIEGESICSQKLSEDTTNSSHLRQNSNCGDIASEKSYIEKDSSYSVMKEQFEREKNNCKIANNQNEALLLQKADLFHKITQLQDQLKVSEESQKSLLNENKTLKTKTEELINSQYANASDKLNMLANNLESKEEEMRTALEDKSLEIQQIKTILDAKQSQISKLNATLELKDNKIKTLEGNIKLLEGELKSKSKEISTFEFSTKNEIESSIKEKQNKINDLKNKLSMKVIRLTKQEEKVADLNKKLTQEKEESMKMQKTMQETIDELKKFNEETTQMYKSKLYQSENELETVKKDIESQKNRIYTAVDSVKADLNIKISERDVVIEKMKSQISILKSKGKSNQSQERHWVIESNLRDIISEHKQTLIKEKSQREKVEKELEMYSEMLIKTKTEWANCEHEKEIYKFESLKKDEVIEEYETEYNSLEAEYQKLLKKSKKN
ncbi:unnamed protein product [Moneuplotes crassus]|uniref:Uncharacterized protein n=1 Tax=Euplotes crassus TaxID=5936 RepID=A0AAD1Y2C5_EUPCR|nr:unnamed protein product [Moneuplotes crassus]